MPKNKNIGQNNKGEKHSQLNKHCSNKLCVSIAFEGHRERDQMENIPHKL